MTVVDDLDAIVEESSRKERSPGLSTRFSLSIKNKRRLTREGTESNLSRETKLPAAIGDE